MRRSRPSSRAASLPTQILCLLLSASLIVGPASAQPREILPPNLGAVIDRGLIFLQKQQKPDGSFEAAGPPQAMAGVAVLAFLAAGHIPDLGRYGPSVTKAIGYLLQQKPKDGYYGRDGGRMYGHCIVTIALAEAYGMETDLQRRREMRVALDEAMQVIFRAQDARKSPEAVGGWRYEPDSPDSDLSVTGWCIAALKACHNAGLSVDRARVDRAMAYILRCYRADQKGFAYQPGGDASASMSAVAIMCLHMAGAQQRDELVSATKFLLAQQPRTDVQHATSILYSTTIGAFHAGDEVFPQVWQRNIERILPAQRQDDGSWPPRRGDPGQDNKPGRFCTTAMSCLTLSIPLRLLPLYQR